MIRIIREEGTDYLFAGFLEKEIKKNPNDLNFELSIEPKRGDYYMCQDYWLTRKEYPFKFLFYALPSHREDIESFMGRDCALVTYAADPDFHKSVDSEKKYNVGFIGRRYYPERIRYLEAIEKFYPRSFLNLDMCPNVDVPRRLDECKVLFNHTRVEIDVNLRFFEEMALGCQVMMRTPALKLFAKEGVHYMGYSSIPEALEVIDRLLKDDNLRNKITHNARKHFLNNHTYSHRVKEIEKQMLAHFERNKQ